MSGCAEIESTARDIAVVYSEAGVSFVPVDEVHANCTTSGCTGPAEVAGITPTLGTPPSRPESPPGLNHPALAVSPEPSERLDIPR